MKRVLTNVTCVNENCDDCPEVFTVTISDDLKDRIKTLSQVVKDAEAFRIEEFNFEGAWSAFNLDPSELDDKGVDKVIEELECDPSSVDCSLLEVTRHYFRWSSIPKYCGDDMLLTTKKIPISFLDDSETLFLNLK